MAILMKGKVYSERKHLLKFPVIAEIKYDEIRCHIIREEMSQNVTFLSYAGKPLHNLERWAHSFYNLMIANNLWELDVGVLVNGNFNDSYRWVRSKKIPDGLTYDMVQFMFFDSPGDTRPYYDRRHLMYCLARDAKAVWGIPATIPESKVCGTEEQLDSYFFEVRSRGFEGLMVKTPSHTYQKGKRIDGWLKMKPEETFDGKIVAINQAFAGVDQYDDSGVLVVKAGTPYDRAGSVTVVLEDGSTASPAGFEWGLASAMWADPSKYIGQWLEFKCMERDRQGGYRHPSFVRFREGKV